MPGPAAGGEARRQSTPHQSSRRCCVEKRIKQVCGLRRRSTVSSRSVQSGQSDRKFDLACWIFGVRDREEGDRGRRDLDRPRRRCHRGKLRKLVIATKLQNRSIQLHLDALQVIRRQRVALAGDGQSQGCGNRSVRIDGQQRDGPSHALPAMRVEVHPMVHAGVENNCADQPAPEHRRPIVWPRPQRLLVKQAVIACGQRVVRHHLDAGFGKPAKLIEISERIEESRSPGIAAASRLGGFGQPHRLVRRKLVPERLVERKRPARARQPRFRKRGLGRGLTRRASLRDRAVVMIGKSVDAGAGCCKQVPRSDESGAGRPG